MSLQADDQSSGGSFTHSGHIVGLRGSGGERSLSAFPVHVRSVQLSSGQTSLLHNSAAQITTGLTQTDRFLHS